METIKVENVKEAIEEIYKLRENPRHKMLRADYVLAKFAAYDECITILENLIVRRQRNEEPR